MADVITVKAAKYVSGYTLELIFSDGLRAEIDFSDWINRYPFFEPLKSIEYFKTFSVDAWTVIWPNGADVAPETLHAIAKNRETQAA